METYDVIIYYFFPVQMYFEPDEIGKFTKFVFWHDNAGDSPGWYLEKVTDFNNLIRSSLYIDI